MRDARALRFQMSRHAAFSLDTSPFDLRRRTSMSQDCVVATDRVSSVNRTRRKADEEGESSKEDGPAPFNELNIPSEYLLT